MIEYHHRTLRTNAIRQMEWGIIKDNTNLPTKRWDPLLTYLDLENEQKLGFFSYVNPSRGARYMEYDHRTPPSHDKASCQVLCPIIKGEDPAIPVYTDQEEYDPFSDVFPISRNYEHYDAITIVNKFPVFGRVDVRKSVKNSYLSGVCLVPLPTQHLEQLEDTPHDILTKLLWNTRDALQYTEKCAQLRGFKQIIPYVFFNIGEKTGGSLKHLHAQIYLDTTKNPSPQNLGFHTLIRLHVQETYYTQYTRCLVCDLVTKTLDVYLGEKLNLKERIIIENEAWLVLSAYAPARNGHIRIFPKKHKARLTDLNNKELAELAKIFRTINSRLNKIGVERDRTTVFFQKPYKCIQTLMKAPFHLYIDVLPFNYIGGIELSGDCLKVIELAPETLAGALKEHSK
ncbi:MAG: HIT domain-containing protein [Candidatus Heimdallarchaeota archaeon]